MSFATTDVGRRSDIALSTVSRLVNEAYFEVAAAEAHAPSQRIAVSSTTTGENRLDLPTDFLEPISASLVYQPSGSTASSAHSSYQTLTLISEADADSLNPQPSGVPGKLAFYNSWMELYPSPNSAYSLQLRYLSQVTDLLETTDVPSVSTPWRQAVSLKAKEKVHAFLQDAAGEAQALDRFLRYVSLLKSDRARRQSGQFRQHIAPSWGEGGRRRRR